MGNTVAALAFSGLLILASYGDLMAPTKSSKAPTADQMSDIKVRFKDGALHITRSPT